MNLFRSKEIYKNTVDQDNNNTLYKMRGLYVVGEYSPPHYIQPLTLLTSIESNKARVVDYIDRYETVYPGDSCHGLLDIDLEGELTIAHYTREQSTIYPGEACHGLLDIDMIDTLTYYKYERDYNQIYPHDECHGLLDIDMGNDIAYVKMCIINKPQHQPSIRITRYETTKAEVVNQIQI